MTTRMFRFAPGAAFISHLIGLTVIAGDSSLVQRFADPPAASRILKIIHNWPDAAPAQDELIRQLSRQGFGGVVSNVSFDDYLVSEPKWTAYVRALDAARKAGWALWLYDERGYPSGNAGGIVLRGHPEWEASGLLIADAVTEGESVSLAVPPGEIVLAAAVPVRGKSIDQEGKIDLFGQVSNGRIEWQPARKAGGWHVLVVTRSRLFEGTHCETNYSAHISYPNLLMPEPTHRFLEVTHERYAQHLGSDLGSRCMSTFTDEPSLMSVFMKPMPYRVLPWAPALPSEFQRRRGYAIEPIIADLVLEGSPTAQRHRYDFWLTISELVSENYFGQIQDWCHRHHLRSGGHLLMEESLTAHVPLYGDFLRSARRLDAPSIDCLTSLPSEVPWFIARLAASAAELEGKAIVMSETSDHAQRYRGPGDSRPVREVSEAEIRGNCNRLMVGGVNCITSYYAFAGLSDLALNRLNAWVGRCSTMLTGGHQVADIALVYPLDSVWPRFVPSREWTREAHSAAKVETVYDAAMDTLYGCRRDFTIVDARALKEARTDRSTMVHGSLRWRVVVLPAADTLPLAAWENLARFAREGGVLVALGALPANSESEFPSRRVLALAAEVFGSAGSHPSAQGNSSGGGGVFLPAGSESLLPIVLKGVLDPDIGVADPSAPLRMTHRRIDGHEVYFLINDSHRPWRGGVDFAARGPGEQWDPATGKVQLLSASRPAPLVMEAYGATIVRFAEPPPSARRPLNTGALPGLVIKSLPSSEPTTTAHGRFVAVELHHEPLPGRKDETGFDLRARLTRSKVDCHLFVKFHHDKPQSFEGSDCLVIDTWVRPGQKTRAEILIILHEEGGGDFIAGTGRSLGLPGHERTFLPLSRFQQAGWSQDADGVLDKSRVSDVSIGWGGYLGTEGEEVRFQLARPNLGTVRHEWTSSSHQGAIPGPTHP